MAKLKNAAYENDEDIKIGEPKRMSFDHDNWIYNEVEEPKILKAGNPVPKGWVTNFKELKTRWTPKDSGVWEKR